MTTHYTYTKTRAEGGTTVATTTGIESLTLACEQMAADAWRAVCNGAGKVSPGTRKIFNAARKTADHPDYTGTVVDAIADKLARVVNRHDGACLLRVDGIEYTVTRHTEPVTFTDQDGAIWDMAHAECPRCKHRPTLADKQPVTGYFRCRACSLLFDEPHWRDAESAFVGSVDEDED